MFPRGKQRSCPFGRSELAEIRSSLMSLIDEARGLYWDDPNEESLIEWWIGLTDDDRQALGGRGDRNEADFAVVLAEARKRPLRFWIDQVRVVVRVARFRHWPWSHHNQVDRRIAGLSEVDQELYWACFDHKLEHDEVPERCIAIFAWVHRGIEPPSAGGAPGPL